MLISCLALLLSGGAQTALASDEGGSVKGAVVPAGDDGDLLIRRATYKKEVEQSNANVKEKDENTSKATENLAKARQDLRAADRRGVGEAERRKLDDKVTQASVERDKAHIAWMKAEQENRELKREAQAVEAWSPAEEAEQPVVPLGPRRPGLRWANIPETWPLLEDLNSRAERAWDGMNRSAEHIHQFQQSVFDGADKREGQRIAALLAWEAEQRRLAAQQAEEEKQRRLAAQRAREAERRLAARRAEEERRRREEDRDELEPAVFSFTQLSGE